MNKRKHLSHRAITGLPALILVPQYALDHRDATVQDSCGRRRNE